MTEFEKLVLEQFAKINEKLQSLENGLAVAPTQSIKCNAFEFVKQWFETEYKNNVSKNTHHRDSIVLKNQLYNKPQFDKKLEEFTRNDITAVLNAIPSTNQRNITSGLLLSALKFAYDNRLIAKDITSKYKKPQHIQKEDRALTHDEEIKLVNDLKGNRLERVILFYLYSGVRRGEGLGIQRKHIDFEKDEIHIEQQLTTSGKFTTKLKTLSSHRVIKLFPWLKTALLPLKDLPSNARLFKFSCNFLTEQFSIFCAEHGLKEFTIKSCRTTFATRCKEIGIPDMIIQKWLGHTTLRTTNRYYIKINVDFVQAEFEKAIERQGKKDE